MSPTRWQIAVAALLFDLLGCSEPVSTVGGLRVDFRLRPAVVQPGELMLATLTITNPTADPVTLTSGSACVTTLDALKDGQRVDIQGTQFGCYLMTSAYRIAPHDSLVREFDLVAMAREAQPPWRYVDPPAPGSYRLRAAMEVNLPDQNVDFRVAR
jgi:hypothetical protein